ncbi:ECA4, partial [Symbiodinium sp. KB8]
MESSGFCRAMSQSLASLLLLAPLALGAAPSFWPRYGGAREVVLLDGEWQFGFNSDRSFDVLAPLDTKDPSLTPNRTSVPASVDAAPPGVLGRRGVALYRTHFLQNGHARLQFMGCSFYCRVFVDGQEVGEHRAGGYVPWWLDLPVPGTGNATRELFVMADNRFNRTTAPVHTGGDFWNYGGIVRSVLLHDMPDDPKETWPWRAYVFPTAEDLGVVDIKIVMTSANFSGAVMIMLAFGTQEPSA